MIAFRLTFQLIQKLANRSESQVHSGDGRSQGHNDTPPSLSMPSLKARFGASIHATVATTIISIFVLKLYRRS